MRPIILKVFLYASILFLANCQAPGTTFTQADLDAAESEVAAELETFWEVWQAAAVDEGMAYFSDDPALEFITDGYLWESKSAAEVAHRPMFESMERQEMEASETRIHALSPDVVQIVQTATYTQYFRDGEVSPAREFALSMTWVRESGNWKVMSYHFSQENIVPAARRSVNLFNLPSGIQESQLVEALHPVNSAILELGYPSAGYSLWKMEGAQNPDATPIGFEYIMMGHWPDQTAYDEIHQADAYLAAGEPAEALFDQVLANARYARYQRVNLGGPEER